MPSSITLTVSHLPTSTSFFLAALQPLNYGYRGRSGNTIGFGPLSPPNTPPDFWITQETQDVPAGAAHVAFPAASRDVVQDFYVAALKAGGKSHGEPCVRDQYGYYSAAVIDFDGNSIEAVYRPSINYEDKENVNSMALAKISSKAPSTMVRSNTTRSPTHAQSTTSRAKTIASQAPTTATQKSKPTGDVFDVFNVARDLVDRVSPGSNNTSRGQAETRKESNSGDAIVGTLLGVAAGAALHYAFTNRSKDNDSDDDSNHRARRPSMTERSATAPTRARSSARHENPRYFAIEGPPSTYSNSQAGGRRYITMQDNDPQSDYATTIRPTRRNSIDSGFGSSSTGFSDKSRRGSGERRKAEPPSSYRGPQSTSQQADKTRSRASSLTRTASRRSSSRNRASRGPDDIDDRGREPKTVYHVTEEIRSNFKPTHGTAGSRTSPSSASKKDSADDAFIRKQPPSRAATWAAPGSQAGSKTTYVSAKSNKTAFPDPRQVKQPPTQSVVGKSRETKRVDVPEAEVRPDDSISQISVNPSSRRSRRR